MGRPSEFEISTDAQNGLPPPSYNQATDGNPQSRIADPDRKVGLDAPQPAGSSRFPAAFHGYLKNFSRSIVIGEHENQPLYAISIHSGMTSNPDIVFHDGPTTKDAALASGKNKGLRCDLTVTLPPLPGVGGDRSVSELIGKYGLHTKYRFTMMVGNEGHLVNEEFEWRGSHSVELRGMDKHMRGWKLVRLSTPPVGAGGSRAERAAGETSDGHEVVAAYSMNSSFSLKKAMHFQFFGSGLTGELGDRWALMTVISAVRIWTLEMTSIATSAAVAAS